MTDESNGVLIQVKSYGKMLLVSLGVVLLAYITAYILNRQLQLPKFWIDIFEFIGYIAWGTALAESKLENWCKNSFPEILYHRLQIVLSMVGIFAFVLASALASKQ